MDDNFTDRNTNNLVTIQEKETRYHGKPLPGSFSQRCKIKNNYKIAKNRY